MKSCVFSSFRVSSLYVDVDAHVSKAFFPYFSDIRRKENIFRHSNVFLSYPQHNVRSTFLPYTLSVQDIEDGTTHRSVHNCTWVRHLDLDRSTALDTDSTALPPFLTSFLPQTSSSPPPPAAPSPAPAPCSEPYQVHVSQPEFVPYLFFHFLAHHSPPPPGRPCSESL